VGFTAHGFRTIQSHEPVCRNKRGHERIGFFTCPGTIRRLPTFIRRLGTCPDANAFGDTESDTGTYRNPGPRSDGDSGSDSCTDGHTGANTGRHPHACTG
jgi:hypothetical protein